MATFSSSTDASPSQAGRGMGADRRRACARRRNVARRAAGMGESRGNVATVLRDRQSCSFARAVTHSRSATGSGDDGQRLANLGGRIVRQLVLGRNGVARLCRHPDQRGRDRDVVVATPHDVGNRAGCYRNSDLYPHTLVDLRAPRDCRQRRNMAAARHRLDRTDSVLRRDVVGRRHQRSMT